MARAGIALAMMLAALGIGTGARDVSADLVIRGGTIYPGDAPPFRGYVAIRGDRIVYVGPAAPRDARREIDATGQIVAPGFVDPHAHIDDALGASDPAARLVLPFLMQGVTTAVVGVDGAGPATAPPSSGATGINHARYVGLGALRTAVIGADDRPPLPRERDRMTAMVSRAMCDGALGLSTGLFYAPQSFATRDEVIALARAAAAHGGRYDSHIRDESSYTIGLAGAIDEALAIGRAAAIPVHIAHIKALGADVWGQAPAVIARIATARAQGQIVTADQYPWSASGTGLSAALLPRWAQDGGRAAMLRRFDDPAVMAKMRPAIADNLRRRGGATALLVTTGPRAVEGMTLAAIAAQRRVEPIDAAIALLRDGEVVVASFSQREDDIAAFMRQPWVVTGSDALLGHPRYYASFARKYATYVREKKVIDLRAFIDRSTAVTADALGLAHRGRLRIGAFADVIAFDPQGFAARADYAHPYLLSTGMRTVVVNGAVAIADGAPTGVSAGRALRHTPTGRCP